MTGTLNNNKRIVRKELNCLKNMSNETLFKLLEKHANEDKLPILDNQTFDQYTNEFGKDVFRETLSEYIATVRPKFPLKKIDEQTVRTKFNELQKADYRKCDDRLLHTD